MKAERSHVSHLKSEMAKLREQLRKEREDSTSEEKDRYKQLESKKGEAYAQSLANRDERIQVLEGRLEQVTANSSKLMEELQNTKKQNEKLKHLAKNAGYNSLRRYVYIGVFLIEQSICISLTFFRDSTPSKYALSDAELTKLKEKAKELSRVREKMRALQDEVSTTACTCSIH